MSELHRPAKAVNYGAVGGPSTGRGLQYQNKYAVLLALELIDRCLAAPYQTFEITVEPRIVSDETATAWDLSIQPDGSFSEVKLNPTRADILDWIDRSVVAFAADHARTFVFVYSTGGGPLLATVQQLLRIAAEAGGKAERFNRILEMEEAQDGAALCARIGDAPHAFLRQLRLVQQPESGLDQEINFRARRISGEVGGKRLRQFFLQKFDESAPKRQTVDIRQSIRELQADGIELQPPPEVAAPDLPTDVAYMLRLLQVCPQGIPAEALAQTLAITIDDLALRLLSLRERGIVSLGDGLWRLIPLPSELTVRDEANLCGGLLQSMLSYIHAHRNDPAGRAQVLNAIDLARRGSTSCPHEIAQLFRTLDKLLKRRGDKHLVLEVADLSIAAARRPGQVRTVEVVKGEAVALICGKSWVYQRIGRLSEALLIAQLSLELGESIGWDRNTAFCLKCIGRLHRMQAEAEADKRAAAPFLERSEKSLQEAIQRFSASTEFGPSDPEVGDCYSLLGRTYLVGGMLAKATDAAKRASDLISDCTSKDYLDLLILRGDLAAAKEDRELADTHYRDALSWSDEAGAEVTEMLARANLKCGLNERAMGKPKMAARRLERASEIWCQLGEDEAAAEAEWHRVLLTQELPVQTLQLLSAQKPAVRVAAVRRHQELVQQAPKSRARRSEPGEEYWKQRIKEAKGKVALEVRSW